MTSAFLDLLNADQVGWHEGRAVWNSRSILRYSSKLLDCTIYTPAEFLTDLASVPRLPVLWTLDGGRAMRPSLPHDFAYQFGYYFIWEPTPNLVGPSILPVTRQMADAVLYEACRADPISGADSWVIAKSIWSGVRVGGRGTWNKRLQRTPELNPVWAKEFTVLAPESP